MEEHPVTEVTSGGAGRRESRKTGEVDFRSKTVTNDRTSSRYHFPTHICLAVSGWNFAGQFLVIYEGSFAGDQQKSLCRSVFLESDEAGVSGGGFA